MRRHVVIFLALLVLSFAAPGFAQAASPGDIEEAVRLIQEKQWVPRVKEKKYVFDEERGFIALRFVQNRRLYTVSYSGTHEISRNSNAGIEVPPEKPKLVVIMHPNSESEDSTYYLLVDLGLDGTVNKAQETNPMVRPARSTRSFSDGSGPCPFKKEFCGPKGMELQAEWQKIYDGQFIPDLLAFLRNK